MALYHTRKYGVALICCKYTIKYRTYNTFPSKKMFESLFLTFQQEKLTKLNLCQPMHPHHISCKLRFYPLRYETYSKRRLFLWQRVAHHEESPHSTMCGITDKVSDICLAVIVGDSFIKFSIFC